MSEQKIEDGGPAFPRIYGPDGGWGGMTLRDYFAGQALAGIHASLSTSSAWPSDDAMKKMAERAYKHSDAMLAERKRGGSS